MDQLRALAVFAAVVEQQSFAAAADQLNLSRTAASKLVRDLENMLGTTLLNRTTRSLSLTTAGSAYYEKIQPLLEQLTEADREASESTMEPTGKIRLAAPLSFGTKYIAPILGQFTKRFPQLKLDLILSDSDTDMISDQIDLAIRIGSLPDSTLMARRIATSSLMLCAAPAYLKEFGEPQSIDDLVDHQCLTFPYRTGHQSWQLVHKDGQKVSVPIRHSIWCNNGDALVNAAIEGAGLIYHPHFIVADALEAGLLMPVLQDFHGGEVAIQLVRPQSTYLPLRTKLMMDFVDKAIRTRFN